MNKRKQIERRGRFPAAAVLAVSAFLLAGCSSRDTVALETEEIVRSETENPGNAAQEPEEGLSEDGPAETYGLQEGGRDQTGGLPDTAAGQKPDTAAGQKDIPSLLFVHICGAVVKPGVYGLSPGSRVYEAVEEAGGFTETADQDYVNLSLPLEDGWKIEIPTLEETAALAASGTAEDPKQPGTASDRSGILCGENPADSASQAAGDGEQVNINTASAEALCTLPGIGESRAERIIAYREKNGAFARIEDIMKIEGIKEGMFSRLKDRICVR